MAYTLVTQKEGDKMKIEMAFLHYEGRGSSQSCSAKLFIEGLGQIEIANCFSQDTFDRIAIEVETALRIRLGQKCEAVNNEGTQNVGEL